MYEVLKFIEHGDHCRQSLDCVRGTTLLAYLRDAPEIEKEALLRWFRELAVCVDQFHRCRKGQDFRYLNPCSIVISEEGRLMLLDMDAPDNSAAARRMQKGAVREHFVKPVYRMGVRKNNEADLFAYGRTIQFMLACTEVSPPLTRREEMKLQRVIGRCTGEKQRYENMQQIIADLPAVSGKRRVRGDRCTDGRPGGKRKLLSVFALSTAACLLLWTAVFAREQEDQEARENVEIPESTAFVPADDLQEELELGVQTDDTESRYTAEVSLIAGTGTERLRAAAEKTILEEELLLAYGRLTELEKDAAVAEETAIKKMELEAARGDHNAALLTGREALAKIKESEKIAELLEIYEREAEKI